jgi:hypothetical protein
VYRSEACSLGECDVDSIEGDDEVLGTVYLFESSDNSGFAGAEKGQFIVKQAVGLGHTFELATRSPRAGRRS